MAMLHDIVTDLVARSDIRRQFGARSAVAIDVNLSQLDNDTVVGFTVDRPMSVVQALEQLRLVYQFDIEEIDGTVHFISRNQRPVRAQITAAETLTGVTAEHVQEAEVPRAVTLTYVDAGRIPDFATALAQRSMVPDFETVASRQRQDAKVFVALANDEARQYAERNLYDAWLERDRVIVDLPPSMLLLNPTDHVTVTLEDGRVFTGRIVETELGADRVNRITVVPYEFSAAGDLAVNTSVQGFVSFGADPVQVPLPGVVPGRAPGQVPATGVTTDTLTVLSLPLLSDFDAQSTTRPALNAYAALLQSSVDGWVEAQIERLTGTDIWTSQALGFFPPALTGMLTAVPRDPPSYNRSDPDGVLTVQPDAYHNFEELFAGIISGSYLDMLNEINRVVLIKTATGTRLSEDTQLGEVAVVAYQTVERRAGETVLRLNGLVRGMRGTETVDKDYLEGDLVVFLPPPPGSLEPLPVPNGLLNQSSQYRAVFDTLLSNVVTHSHTGLELRPYAPAGVQGTFEANGDTTITWDRRTRVGGERDLEDQITEVPLGEFDANGAAYERYDLVIDGIAIDRRTVEDLTEPRYVYTLDQKLEDGFSRQVPGFITTNVPVPGGDDFENLMTDWTIDTETAATGVMAATSVPLVGFDDILPNTGTHLLRQEPTGPEDFTVSQTLNLSASNILDIQGGDSSLVLNAFLATLNTTSDPGRIRVECLSFDDRILANAQSDSTSPGQRWVLQEAIVAMVPIDTVKVRISLIAEYTAGRVTNTYFDTVSLRFRRPDPTAALVNRLTADVTVQQKSSLVGAGPPVTEELEL